MKKYNHHIVNISGGKDSQATALLAAERGMPFRLVMADTGNESSITIEHAHYLAEFLDVKLEVFKYDFSEKLSKKREFIELNWAKDGVPQSQIDSAIEALRPTGNPFLDLCLWKGRFPSRKAQFCTEWLKANTISEQVVEPLLDTNHVIQWLGVRRDESINRRNSAMYQRVYRADKPHNILLFRPLVHWTADNVFSFSKTKGIEQNPLYLEGMRRVGCFPCINSSKKELRQIGARYKDAVERIVEWEKIVKSATKRNSATFFGPDTTPKGARLIKNLKTDSITTAKKQFPHLSGIELEKAISKVKIEISAKTDWPNAKEVFDWAETDTGGAQLNWLFNLEETGCSSHYGLCE